MLPSVFFCLQDTHNDARRLGIAARRLAQTGLRVKTAPAATTQDLQTYDVFVFANPHTSAPAMQVLAACLKAGRQVVVDLSEDFFHMAADHPAYHRCGPGNPRALQMLEQILRAAAAVVISTSQLAEPYARFCRQMHIIPDGWDRTNPLWEQTVPSSNGVRLGWYGSAEMRADLAALRLMLERVLQDCPETQLVLADDMAAFHLFERLPEQRLLVLPPVGFDDIPYVLAYMDILLVPARGNPSSAGRLEPLLRYAGARRIPWVAPALFASQQWGAGGLTAGSMEEWQAALLRLVHEPQTRVELGWQGREKAETYSNGELAAAWTTVLTTLRI